MLDWVRSGVGLSLVRDAIALRESHAHGLSGAGRNVGADRADAGDPRRARRNEPAIAALFDLTAAVFQP